MPVKMRMTEAIAAYLGRRKAAGRSVNTLTNDRFVLERLLTVTGDIYLGSIGNHHIDMYFAKAGQTRSVNSLAIDHTVLSCFCKWGMQMRQIGRLDNPMEGRTAAKLVTKDHSRVPVGKFPALLDAAATPRDRAVVALGLYLFLRASEVKALRVRDLNLDAGEVLVTIAKTRDSDRMPLCAELDTELRRWLRSYQAECGPLDPDWFLVPAYHAGRFSQSYPGGPLRRQTAQALNPQAPWAQPQFSVQQALVGIGWPVRDSEGKSTWEGVHTLRRSGARARFDVLRTQGYDGAMRHVQAMLHHASVTMTERYIGLTLDRYERNQILRGAIMYPVGDNVVSLRQAVDVEDHGAAM